MTRGARGDWDKIDIVGRRATSCARPGPLSPLMNESDRELSIVISADGDRLRRAIRRRCRRLDQTTLRLNTTRYLLLSTTIANHTPFKNDFFFLNNIVFKLLALAIFRKG